MAPSSLKRARVVPLPPAPLSSTAQNLQLPQVLVDTWVVQSFGMKRRGSPGSSTASPTDGAATPTSSGGANGTYAALGVALAPAAARQLHFAAAQGDGQSTPVAQQQQRNVKIGVAPEPGTPSSLNGTPTAVASKLLGGMQLGSALLTGGLRALETDQPAGLPGFEPADDGVLLPKVQVHATSSLRLAGLRDTLLMLLALLPTVVMRVVRNAMGLLGVTEHRWRGISMVEPLTAADRQQLATLCNDLIAGTLGRRPEPPALGPVAPGQQLLLDVHTVLAATAATASSFGLPYEGFPEAQLQAKLATYLRSIAAGDSACPQVGCWVEGRGAWSQWGGDVLGCLPCAWELFFEMHRKIGIA